MICSKCNIIKDKSLFVVDKNKSAGIRSYCKECRNKSEKKFQPNINLNEKYCNTCKIIKEITYFYTCPRYHDGYDIDCFDCRSMKTHKTYIRNKEKIKARSSEYYYENKNKIREIKKKYQRKMTKTDIFYKIKRNLRNRLYYAIQNKIWKKDTHFTEYIGCDRNTLIKHIEKQFKSGMTWDNYGVWHIDHINPLSKAQTEQELYKLCHYTNLQPLMAIDNLKKGGYGS